ELLEVRNLLSATDFVTTNNVSLFQRGVEELQSQHGDPTPHDTRLDAGAEDEERPGGDLIAFDAIEEQYGPFDYKNYLQQVQKGLFPPQGGAVPPGSFQNEVLTNNDNGSTGTQGFTQSETSVIAFGNTVVVAYNDSGSFGGGSNHFTGFSSSTDGG